MDLFLLQSPLQIICASEVIYLKNKEIKNYNFKIILFNKKQNLNNRINQNSLKFLNLPLFYSHPYSDNFLIKLIYWLKIRRKLTRFKNIENIYLGEFLPSQIVASGNLFKYAKKWVIDDGNCMLLLPKYKYEKLFYKKLKPVNYKLISYNTNLSEKINVFSIYDIKMKKNDVLIKNELSFLSDKINFSKSGCVVFIGSAMIEAQVMKEDVFLKYIDSSFSYLEKKYGRNIIYCPHRSEDINNKKHIINKYGIEIINTELPIELYISNKSLKIQMIAGFISSAFDTLNIIAGNKQLINSFFINRKDFISKSFREISDRSYKNYKKKYKSIEVIKNY